MTSRFAVFAGLAIFCSGFLLNRPVQSRAAECEPSVEVEPMTSGLARVALSAPCLSGHKVRILYGGLELVRNLDEAGHLTSVFDCFLGEKIPLTLSIAGGPDIPVELRTLDLDRVTIVAVSWRGSVNLDLHAFEYAAKLADENHVWAGSPGSPWQAEERKRRDGRGHGFISFASDGTAEGDQLEVYTFIHAPNQSSGAVTLALDYESRARRPQDPDTCGTGLYADLEYKVSVWHPGGRISRSRGMFAPLPCDRPADEIARYSAKALPQLLLMR
jgi:hypothetical protein